MLTRLWRMIRPQKKPEPFDFATWERVMGMAADAHPVRLTARMTDEDVNALASGVRDEWDQLKASMQPGDELWRFSSPQEAWRARMGRAGIALVRNGEVVSTVVTMLN